MNLCLFVAPQKYVAEFPKETDAEHERMVPDLGQFPRTVSRDTSDSTMRKCCRSHCSVYLPRNSHGAESCLLVMFKKFLHRLAEGSLLLRRKKLEREGSTLSLAKRTHSSLNESAPGDVQRSASLLHVSSPNGAQTTLCKFSASMITVALLLKMLRVLLLVLVLASAAEPEAFSADTSSHA